MSNVYEQLIDRWKSEGTQPSLHRATSDEIASWQKQWSVLLPPDFVEYVTRINGFQGAAELDFDGAEMLSFLPLSSIVPEREWSANENRPNMFVFVDHCIQCYWYCAYLTPEPQPSTPIFLGRNRIADSIPEFLEIYLTRSPKLYQLR